MLVDTLALKLHVDHGVVWALRGREHPASTRLSIKELYNSNLLDDVATVCVVGSAQNAELIVALYDKWCDRSITSLQLVTPLVCSTAADRQRPEAVLYHMQRFSKAASLGGYHEVTKDDFLAYALRYAFDKNDGEFWEEVEAVYHTHPASKALHFIAGLDHAACAKLLSIMLDPRWYVDLCRPDRGAKLEAYFGLNPKTQAGVLDPESEQWRHHDRCELVTDCWYSVDKAEAAADTYVQYGIDDFGHFDKFGLRPGDFLWRVWAGHMGYRHKADEVKAVLRGSQKFLQYVRLTWLAQLYSTSRSTGDASLFRASDFFPHVVEATAYDHYILQR